MVRMGTNNNHTPMIFLRNFQCPFKVFRTLCAIMKSFIGVKVHIIHQAECSFCFTCNTYTYGICGKVINATHCKCLVKIEYHIESNILPTPSVWKINSKYDNLTSNRSTICAFMYYMILHVHGNVHDLH